MVEDRNKECLQNKNQDKEKTDIKPLEANPKQMCDANSLTQTEVFQQER